MDNEVLTIRNFSAEDKTAEIIKDNLVKICKYSIANNIQYSKVAELSFAKENIENYEKINEEVKLALLKYSADKAGIKEIKNKADVINAFANPTFQTIFNSIITDALTSIVLKSRPEQIWRLANVVDVEVS